MSNIFQTCYDLCSNYLFGGSVELMSYADLICMLLSTIGTIFCVAIPFMVVYKFLQWVARI